jgi:AraC family transcriptional regulator
MKKSCFFIFKNVTVGQTIINQHPGKGYLQVEVKFVEKGEFKLIGIERYTKNDYEIINQCWSTLNSRIDEIRNRINTDITYGFQDYSKDFDIVNLSFNYIAAVEVSSLEHIPEGMVGKSVPASRYAVFSHEGARRDISSVIRHIYTMWFSEFDYELNDEVCGDFEYYDKNWDCSEENCKMEIYIPIR